MAEGDRQRSDYPSYGDEFLKCREFLQKYSEGEDNLPYQVQLVRILYLVVVLTSYLFWYWLWATLSFPTLPPSLTNVVLISICCS